MPSKNLHNTYHPPPASTLIPILTTGLIMALTTTSRLLSPPSPLYTLLLAGRSPRTLRAAAWIQTGLFYFLFGAHAVETVLFTRRLREHGVASGTGAWWKWMGTCFVGGKFCWAWFDEVVGGKKGV
jgi:hypothetical protein